MFDAGALWFAAKHKVPLLCVMHNNRAYYNDWEHQITVARQRDTPVERAYIGMDIDGSGARISPRSRAAWAGTRKARSTSPATSPPRSKRAIAEVKKGKPALVDTITQHRG